MWFARKALVKALTSGEEVIIFKKIQFIAMHYIVYEVICDIRGDRRERG